MKKLILMISINILYAMQAAQMHKRQYEISAMEKAASTELFSTFLEDSMLTQNTRITTITTLLAKYPKIIDSTANIDGITPLMLAVYKGYYEIVKLFLEAHAALNIQNKYGDTALIWAAYKGRTEIVKLLTIAGASLDIQNTDGWTALMRAADKGDFESVKILMASGANQNIQNVKHQYRTARDYAENKVAYDVAMKAGLDILQEQYAKKQITSHNIIAHEVTNITSLVDIISDYAYNPRNTDDLPDMQQEMNVAEHTAKLISAIINQELTELVRYTVIATLLQKHPHSANARHTMGYTALIAASGYGYTEIVKLLIAVGALLDIQDTEGLTALIWAARNGHTQIVKVLLAAGASLDILTTDGWTALMWATNNGRIEIAKILITAGASLDMQNIGGATALMSAAGNGYMEIVSALIAVGVDPGIRNDKDSNKTARDCARNIVAYDAAMQAGLDKKERYVREQKNARHIIAQEVTHVASLVDIISDYSYNPRNPDELIAS